mmetsp:Transcript_1394/g.3054  ORF Transcript_1394/g.3054 Transcript_1394/m.3054 type:complete len:253 (-) Transcript_1394:17-775(-)
MYFVPGVLAVSVVPGERLDHIRVRPGVPRPRLDQHPPGLEHGLELPVVVPGDGLGVGPVLEQLPVLCCDRRPELLEELIRLVVVLLAQGHPLDLPVPAEVGAVLHEQAGVVHGLGGSLPLTLGHPFHIHLVGVLKILLLRPQRLQQPGRVREGGEGYVLALVHPLVDVVHGEHGEHGLEPGHHLGVELGAPLGVGLGVVQIQVRVHEVQDVATIDLARSLGALDVHLAEQLPDRLHPAGFEGVLKFGVLFLR